MEHHQSMPQHMYPYIYMCIYVNIHHSYVYTHTTCTDLHHSVEVDPVSQEVVMWSVREDSQHGGYRQW